MGCAGYCCTRPLIIKSVLFRENKITVQLRNTKTSESESEKALSDKSSSLPPSEEVGNNHKSPALSTTPPVKVGKVSVFL